MNFIQSLKNYEPGQIISKDLEFVNKEDIAKASFLKKLSYWVNGTFKAKNTAFKIDQFMQVYLNKKISEFSKEDLSQIKTKLELLNKKFSKKGVYLLQKSINTIEELMKSINNISKSKKNIPSHKDLKSYVMQNSIEKEYQNKKNVEKNLTSTPINKVKSKYDSISKDIVQIQNKINSLDIKNKNLKNDAREIKNLLENLSNNEPKLKNQLSSLIAIMKAIEQKGVLAFKPHFIQEKFIEKYGKNSQSHDPSRLQAPLKQFFEFLKIASTSNPNQFLSKLSQVNPKWSELEKNFFIERLNLSSQASKNVLKATETFIQLREKLSEKYEESSDKITKENYSNAEFKKLIDHYPDDNIQKTQEINLDELLEDLMEIMLKNVKLTSETEKNWDKIHSNLYKIGLKRIDHFISSSIQKYDWLKQNLASIKIPYDQGVDHDRNLGEGTCLQNSLRRFIQLSDNSSAENIEMGSDETGRKNQALMNLEKNLAFNKGDAVLVKILGEQGIKMVKNTSSSLKNKASVDHFKEAVNKILPDQQSNGLLLLSGKEGTHVMNIQINPKTNNYRIIDDNVGLMEFSSVLDLKSNLYTFLHVFYPTSQELKFFEFEKL